MWSFLRRQFLYFLIGFVLTFVIYLFVRFDADKVLLGVAIGAVGGILAAIVLFALERRFPEQTPTSGT
jgi:mannose/fructose/N-acetylgalactosamine-specific phosphotransferase system component IIC